jgi:Rps23 Pro-64 3,4-dihydroxylase Tpa1-like proline 4-hydroxylase
MQEQIIEVSKNRKIIVVDGLYTFSEISGFELEFNSAQYKISGTNAYEIQNIGNKRLIHHYDGGYLHSMKFFNEACVETLKKYISPSDYAFDVGYVNCGIHADQHGIHADDWHAGHGKTLLYYGNKQWDKNWGGSTLFYNDDCQDIIYNCSFIPGRIVIFDSDIPHSATPQHFIADPFRFTLALKFKDPKTAV